MIANSLGKVRMTINKSLAPKDLQGLRVLLVEDSPDNQLLVKRKLENMNAVVTTASNGKEGLLSAGSSEFDVILMDIQMPEMDGLEATAILRKRGWLRPVIALSAYATLEERERCLSHGFTDHVCKPIDFRALFDKLEAVPRNLPQNPLKPVGTTARNKSEISPPSIERSM